MTILSQPIKTYDAGQIPKGASTNIPLNQITSLAIPIIVNSALYALGFISPAMLAISAFMTIAPQIATKVTGNPPVTLDGIFQKYCTQPEPKPEPNSVNS